MSATIRPPAIRVVIADDHPIVRAGLAQMLGDVEDIDVVGLGATGRDAVVLARDLVPDLVVMDLSMPDVDGIAATREIAAGSPDTRVLVLTSFVDRGKVLEALDAGAIGYLLKDAEPDELLRAM